MNKGPRKRETKIDQIDQITQKGQNLLQSALVCGYAHDMMERLHAQIPAEVFSSLPAEEQQMYDLKNLEDKIFATKSLDEVKGILFGAIGYYRRVLAHSANSSYQAPPTLASAPR